MPSRAAIAYRIVTARLILRCWDPSTAEALNSAIALNLDHLRPWMPWAKNAPISLDEQIERLRKCRSEFETQREYGIFDRNTDQFLGGIGFPNRIGAGAREIGYWIRKDRGGRGLMTESAAAMIRVGFEFDGLRRIEIHCDPLNHASAAIPRKLGFVLQCTIPAEVLGPASNPRDTMIWTLLRRDYPGSPATSAHIEAFDIIGRAISMPPAESIVATRAKSLPQ